MNTVKRCTWILFAASLLASLGAAAQESINSMDELLQSVREQGQQTSATNKRREQEFAQKRDQQKAILTATKASLAAEEARGVSLKQQFDQNEKELETLSETLRIRVGDMGELFGVVRQVAGDTKGIVDDSLISAQYPDRGEAASRLAQSKGLPSIEDLRNLQLLLMEEMAESGSIVRFNATVQDAAGHSDDREVVRIGVFNAITANEFLTYDSSDKSLQVLPRQPAGRYVNRAKDLFAAESGTVAMAIDPGRGALLGQFIQAPSFLERVDQGGLVGYAIIAIGMIGLIIALVRLLTLLSVGGKINRQLKSETSSDNNPLGRILGVYDKNSDIDTETLELKLDEAILRETPKLEKLQGIIKVFAAVAPLLGLLGTVVGMIKTFQIITLFGTGDPKLMAGGISQALVTTVEGLVVAIPLVFLHAIISGKSRGLIEVLEEQSAGIIARHSEQRL